MVAPDWEELIDAADRQLSSAAQWMLDAVAPRPGERVLDVAGGPGTMSLLAARAVGTESSVLCSDFAEPMVQAARRRLDAQGATGVACRVLDAEAIDLPDDAVDVVLCRCGYMLMVDPAAALRESARVLAPGGRLALAVWSAAEDNPWAALPMQTVLSYLQAPPPPAGPPGLWALANPDDLRDLLVQAGLRELRCQTLDDTVVYESVGHWLEVTARLAAPLRSALDSVDENGRAVIERRLRENAAPYEHPDGSVVLPERMLVASARR